LKAEERFVTPLLLNCESSRLAAEARVYEREEELLRALKEEIVSLLESVREYSQAVATLDVLCTFAGTFYSSAWTRLIFFASCKLFSCIPVSCLVLCNTVKNQQSRGSVLYSS